MKDIISNPWNINMGEKRKYNQFIPTSHSLYIKLKTLIGIDKYICYDEKYKKYIYRLGKNALEDKLYLFVLDDKNSREVIKELIITDIIKKRKLVVVTTKDCAYSEKYTIDSLHQKIKMNSIYQISNFLDNCLICGLNI